MISNQLITYLRVHDAQPLSGGCCRLWRFFMGLRVYAYIDGFNLYNGSVKKYPQYKWLDLVKFCKRLMAGDNVLNVKYFTALVKEFGDKRRPVRQKTYWRALQAVNGDILQIITGKFRSDPKFYRIAKYQYLNKSSERNEATRNSICVIKPEEKGSDVNLAVHVLNDAWLDLYDIALIISNDSDLAEALNIVKNNLHKEIALANPFCWQRKKIANELRQLQVKNRTIRESQLSECQLPHSIPNTSIHIPPGWCN